MKQKEKLFSFQLINIEMELKQMIATVLIINSVFQDR